MTGDQQNRRPSRRELREIETGQLALGRMVPRRELRRRAEEVERLEAVASGELGIDAAQLDARARRRTSRDDAARTPSGREGDEDESPATESPAESSAEDSREPAAQEPSPREADREIDPDPRPAPLPGTSEGRPEPTRPLRRRRDVRRALETSEMEALASGGEKTETGPRLPGGVAAAGSRAEPDAPDSEHDEVAPAAEDVAGGEPATGSLPVQHSRSGRPSRRSLRQRLEAAETGTHVAVTDEAAGGKGATGTPAATDPVVSRPAREHREYTARRRERSRETGADAERPPRSASRYTSDHRTATGRRPVLRTPTTAQGIRTVDDGTGVLSAIVPLSRPDRGDRDSIEVDLSSALSIPVMTDDVLDAERRRQDRLREAPPSGDRSSEDEAAAGEDTETDSVVEETGAAAVAEPREADADEADAEAEEAESHSGTEDSADRDHVDVQAAPEPEHRAGESGEAAGPVERQSVMSHATTSSPEESPASGEDAAEDDDTSDDETSLQPTWRSLGARSQPAAERVAPPEPAASPEVAAPVTAPSPAAATRVRQDEEEVDVDDEDDEDVNPNPAVTVIKILVLAVVAAVIAGLVWLLASGVLTGGGDASALMPFDLSASFSGVGSS